MRENDKIYIKEYLKTLNARVDDAVKYRHIKADYVKKLTCKELADLCEVTPATITNLTTSSRFYLLHKVAGEILDAYYTYFQYQEQTERKEYPDEVIYPKDLSYVLMCMTSYYTDEFING